MIQTGPDGVIAVDGGGTRSRLALCLSGGARFEAEAGAANVSSDFDGALAQLRAGLTELAGAAGIAPDDLNGLPAYLGLAGVTGPALAQRVAAELPLRAVRIEDDRPAALTGALGSGDGAIAHCGTGSFYALRRTGHIRLAGGWGARLGDEASAQWAGRRALAACLRAADGRAGPTVMARQITRAIGGTEAIVAFAASATPAQMGALAPIVTAAAQAGDCAAHAILTAGAEDIAASLTAMGWQEDMTLCLTGGIGPAYAGFLPEAMRRALRPPRGAPLEGAIALAWELAGGGAP